MQEELVTERFASMPAAKKSGDYNFEHFKTRILLEDSQRTWEARGIPAGEPAPDFELDKVGGGSLRLSELRGQPVLLHFGSYS